MRRPRCGVSCRPLWHTTRDKTIHCCAWCSLFLGPSNTLRLPGPAIIKLILCTLTLALGYLYCTVMLQYLIQHLISPVISSVFFSHPDPLIAIHPSHKFTWTHRPDSSVANHLQKWNWMILEDDFFKLGHFLGDLPEVWQLENLFQSAAIDDSRTLT